MVLTKRAKNKKKTKKRRKEIKNERIYHFLLSAAEIEPIVR